MTKKPRVPVMELFDFREQERVSINGRTLRPFPSYSGCESSGSPLKNRPEPLRTDGAGCILGRPYPKGRPKLPVSESKKFLEGDYMKSKTILLTLAVLFAAVCCAADLNIGTWKLNDAKSKISPGAGKNTTVVIAAAGDSMKVTVDGVDANGKPAHDEWTGKFDGKDYPVTGDPDTDTRAYKPINDHTLAMTQKKGGKITDTGRVVYSADGKTRTVTVSGTVNGKKIRVASVYDKQ